jgi:hypothetical protein
MANPPTSAQYDFTANGASSTLNLSFDAQWNIVNSDIASNPISGSYDPATGQIKFVEQVRGPWPVAPFSFPGYLGYFVPDPSGGGTFAGVFDEIMFVRSGPPPGGNFIWERIEHGWIAFPHVPGAPRKFQPFPPVPRGAK